MKLNCLTVVSLIENTEFDQLCEKKQFVQNIYDHNLKWIHMPIADLKAPDHEFKKKWITTKTLLKNDLLKGGNIVLHCYGGKGRAGTIAAILLIEFGEINENAIKIVRAASNPKSAVGVKLEKVKTKNPVTKIPVVVIIASPVVIIVLSLAIL